MNGRQGTRKSAIVMNVIDFSSYRCIANKRAKQQTATDPVCYPVGADDWETLEIGIEVDLGVARTKASPSCYGEIDSKSPDQTLRSARCAVINLTEPHGTIT